MTTCYDSTVQYSLVRGADGTAFLTAFADEWDAPLTARSDHPNFAAVLAAVEAGDAREARDLFDAAATVAARFRPLSERVSVGAGRVYFDGDEVDDAVTRQVLRFLDEGEPFGPLVAFMESLAANPSAHSREQLYGFLRAHDFTLTPDGSFVGYKGVDRELLSGFAGTAIVDGQSVTGKIPNRPGSVVEMPRSEVVCDPGVGCSRGLHVGTFEYASGYSRGAMLEVHVAARDVVSVPDDAGFAKVRVCRYRVVRMLEAFHAAAFLPSDDEYADDDDGCAHDW